MKLVVFTLYEQRYALHLFAVVRVVWAVEITRLPKAPPIVSGMINFEGRLVPVVDIGKRFHLPARDLAATDQFLIARTGRRTVALRVDSVTDVMDIADEQLIAAEKILPGLEHVEGVVKLLDGMILVHDLDHFLSLDEERTLDDALKPGEHAP